MAPNYPTTTPRDTFRAMSSRRVYRYGYRGMGEDAPEIDPAAVEAMDQARRVTVARHAAQSASARRRYRRFVAIILPLRLDGLTFEEIGRHCDPPLTRQAVHQNWERYATREDWAELERRKIARKLAPK